MSDCVRFDLKNANVNEPNFDKIKTEKLPDVVSKVTAISLMHAYNCFILSVVSFDRFCSLFEILRLMTLLLIFLSAMNALTFTIMLFGLINTHLFGNCRSL